jgi:hypothetical protein
MTPMDPQRTHFEKFVPDHFTKPAQNQELAIASFVVGLLSCVTLSLLGIGAIAAFIMGVIALRRARNQPATYGGSGFAIAGIATSIGSVVITAAILASAFITIPRIYRQQAMLVREMMAIQNTKYIGSGELTYKNYISMGSYATFDQLRQKNLIAHGPTEQGYRFRVELHDNTFSAYADPETYGVTGRRSFFVTDDGWIHSADHKGEDGSKDDPVIGSVDKTTKNNVRKVYR